MQLTLRSAISVALLALVTGLTACGAEESAEQNRPQDSMTEAELEVLARQAGQTLARELALSLKDAAMRGQLQAAMEQSPVKEGKVHFGSYARGPGRDLLQAMSRQSGKSGAELEELLAQAGSMEMYLPVEEHRAAWKGGEDLLVATAVRDHEAPVAFNLSGEPVTLSAEEPPATPTLVLVPAEDFKADGTPTKRGLALGRGGQRMQASAAMATDDTPFVPGVYVNSVFIPEPRKYESWFFGAFEFEFYLGHVQDSRDTIRCAAEHSDLPFWWNMNKKTWNIPFAIGPDAELPPTGFAMFIYEDDGLADGDHPCAIRQGKDHVKLTLNALKEKDPTNKAFMMKNADQSISFHDSPGEVKDAATHSYWLDEYVGTVTSSGGSIGQEESTYSVRNVGLEETATVKLQWRTSPPPPPPPPGNPGVVFIHGTGDFSPEKAHNYWQQETIEMMLPDISGSKPEHLVVGYKGASCAADSACSWGSIVEQIDSWVKARGITSFTVITHSNGANPVRYMLAHPGDVTPEKRIRIGEVTGLISQVIFMAPTLKGSLIVGNLHLLATFLNYKTQQDDWDDLIGFVMSLVMDGCDLSPEGACMQQHPLLMLLKNADGTFAGARDATTVGGKPIWVIRGTSLGWGGDEYACGGKKVNDGLGVAAFFGWGPLPYLPGARITDGFLGVGSTGYFHNDVTLSFPYLNHNQSRRGCYGTGLIVAQMVADSPIFEHPAQAYAPATNASAGAELH